MAEWLTCCPAPLLPWLCRTGSGADDSHHHHQQPGTVTRIGSALSASSVHSGTDVIALGGTFCKLDPASYPSLGPKGAHLILETGRVATVVFIYFHYSSRSQLDLPLNPAVASADSEAAKGGPGQPPSPSGHRLAAMEAGADGRVLLPACAPNSATTSPTRLRTGGAAVQRVISDWSYPSSTLTTPNTTAAAQCVAACRRFLLGLYFVF